MGKAIAASQLKEILQKRVDGIRMHIISKSMSTSRSTIRKYLKGIAASGYQPIELLKMSDDELNKLIKKLKTTLTERQTSLQSFFPLFTKDLQDSAVNRRQLWRKYRRQFPDGYSYSLFCIRLNEWRSENGEAIYCEAIDADGETLGDKLDPSL